MAAAEYPCSTFCCWWWGWWGPCLVWGRLPVCLCGRARGLEEEDCGLVKVA
jgi:hypothetical protein